MTDPEDAMLEHVIDELRRRGEYRCLIPSTDRAAIDRARARGRRAGRRIGWKVHTFVAEQAGGTCLVTVVVNPSSSSPLHQRLLRARGARALERIYPKPPDPPH